MDVLRPNHVLMNVIIQGWSPTSLRIARFFLERASPRRYDPEREFERDDRKMRPTL
jgi:hypothetical protein